MIALACAVSLVLGAPDFSVPGNVTRIDPLPGLVGVTTYAATEPSSESGYLLTSIGCHDKRTGERVVPFQFNLFERLTVSVDGDAFYGLTYGPDARQGGLSRGSCTRPPARPDDTSDPAFERFSLTTDAPAFEDVYHPLEGNLIAWDRRACIVRAQVIACLDLDADLPTLQVLTTALSVAESIEHPPAYDIPLCKPGQLANGLCPDFDANNLSRPWHFRAGAALPGGRIAAIIEPERPTFASGEWLSAVPAYLVLLEPDGSLERMLLGPATRWFEVFYNGGAVEARPAGDNARPSPLKDVDVLYYTPDLDAVAFGGGNFAALNHDGIGHIELAGAARPYLPLGPGWGLGSNFVRWDRDAVDLDQDGLRASAEAALGTSDWRWDSDGDGVSDATEVATGRSPTAFEGEWTGDVQVAWTVSTWLSRWRVPELGAVDSGLVYTMPHGAGVAGPLCFLRRCVFSDGRRLELPEYVDHVSIDGRWAILYGGGPYGRDFAKGVSRTDLLTGMTTPWLAPGALPSDATLLVEDAGGGYALDRRFDDSIGSRVLYRIDGDTPRILFDGGGEVELEPVGYHGESRRLLVLAHGTHGQWLLAASHDGVELMESEWGMTRDNRWQGFGDWSTRWGPLFGDGAPRWLMPSGLGEYVGDRWIYTAHLADSTQHVNAMGGEHGLIGGWGDTLVMRDSGDELERVPLEVLPGDVLFLYRDVPAENREAVRGYPWDTAIGVQTVDRLGGYAPTHLFRVGPRGGVTNLWSAPRYDLPTAPDPDGARSRMALSPNGRLCVVNSEAQAFVELSPVLSDRIPVLQTAALYGHSFEECRYVDDDTIEFSLDGLTHRWRRAESGALADLGTPWPAAASLLPADYPRVQTAVEGAFAAYGATVALDRVVDSATRADGVSVLLVEAHRTAMGEDIGDAFVVAYHPAFDEAAYLPVFGSVEAVARAPGGVGRDPWTGAALAPGTTWGRDPTQAFVLAGHEGGSDDTTDPDTIAPDATHKPRGDGCTGAPPVWWALVLLGLRRWAS